jgi:ABC-2 type transport system permease protein
MLKRLRAIILKEINHILRDPRSLTIIFVMPILMVLLYGYALNMDIKHICLAVIDYDHTDESRKIIRSFKASSYFNITVYAQTRDQVERLLKNGDIKAALIIPRDFTKHRSTNRVSSVQLLVDGSDPTFGNASINYANAIITLADLQGAGTVQPIPLGIRDRYLYNPDLKGANFIIPGLVAVILMMVCALLTSITLAREKETGTFEILLVSPVRPVEVVVGKVLPYVVISFMDGVFILLFAKLVFDIPLKGELSLLLGLSVLFVYCALSIGLFISSIAKTQQVAMMAALVSTILPSVILSGFIFPIFSMPAPLRALTAIVPAKYYMIIIRGILLKSGTFDMFKNDALFLFLLGSLFLLMATMKFKTRVNQ